jgi:hypothetical protein
MSWAHVSQSGAIIQIVGKIPQGLRLQSGERLLPFDWPQVDTDLVDVVPVTPVSENATLVSFNVTSKVDAADILERRSIAQIDRDVDKIYADAIGNRGPEYTQAEKEAQEYKDAGYTGNVPHYVNVWASAKGQSATWAADDILAQATAWRSAASIIRESRLATKELVRAGNASTAMPAWNIFVSGIRSQLGI